MPTAGREVQLARYPAGAVTPSHFRVVEVTTRDPRPGEVLVRNAWTSVDPGMRLRMAPRGPDGYFGAFALNRALDGIMSVGVVIAPASCTSRAPVSLKPSSMFVGMLRKISGSSAF